MSDSQLRVGDVVWLRSGSVAMTVDAVNSDGKVHCRWFTADDVKVAVFSPASLTKTHP